MEAGIKKIDSPEVKVVRLEIGEDGEMLVREGDQRKRGHLKVCFPWTSPHRFISVRDDEENELALIEDPRSLDLQSRKAVEEMLVRARFVFTITSIELAEAEFELRQWKVNTVQGPRRFQTKLDHWPYPLAEGGFLLHDLGGDLYHIVDPATLDDRSRRILWAFVD